MTSVWDTSLDAAFAHVDAGRSAWRYRPPPSPEWPPGLWRYAAADADATAEDVEAHIASRYVGDWAPDRVRWTIEPVGRVPNLTPSQKTAIRSKAEVGRMFLLEEEEEEEVTEARPGLGHRHRPPRTEIPPGTPIRRLPPGAAGGAGPFDWPNPSMSVVANSRLPNKGTRLKRPRLTDARRMAKKHPRTFELPSKDAVADLDVGDFAKVATEGERFWVRVTERDGAKFQGVVDNDLVATELHGLRLGDRVAFESRHLYAAVTNEQMLRAQADRLAANPLDPNARLRRRSDEVPPLVSRLRRLKDHLDSVEDILDRGSPSSTEARALFLDKKRLERDIRQIDDKIDAIEATIELEGDLVEAPPRSLWGTRVPNPRPY